MAGTEAGGNVAAGVALKARDQMPGGLTGQILLSPMIDPRMTHAFHPPGERDRHAGPLVGRMAQLSARNALRHPASLCGALSLFPADGGCPALVLTSEDDPLKDEALGYADRLAQGGSLVRRTILPDSFGWTGIYRGKTGLWVEALRTAFSQFVEELRPAPGRVCGRGPSSPLTPLF